MTSTDVWIHKPANGSAMPPLRQPSSPSLSRRAFKTCPPPLPPPSPRAPAPHKNPASGGSSSQTKLFASAGPAGRKQVLTLPQPRPAEACGRPHTRQGRGHQASRRAAAAASEGAGGGTGGFSPAWRSAAIKPATRRHGGAGRGLNAERPLKGKRRRRERERETPEGGGDLLAKGDAFKEPDGASPA